MHVQFVGATLFEVSVIVGAPYVIAGKWGAVHTPAGHRLTGVTRSTDQTSFCAAEESSTNWWTWDAAYWAMQVRSSQQGVGVHNLL